PRGIARSPLRKRLRQLQHLRTFDSTPENVGEVVCMREKFIRSDSSPKRAGIEDRDSARVIMCCTWLEYQPTGSRRSQWRGGTKHRRRQAEAPSHGTGGECAPDAAELGGSRPC